MDALSVVGGDVYFPYLGEKYLYLACTDAGISLNFPQKLQILWGNADTQLFPKLLGSVFRRSQILPKASGKFSAALHTGGMTENGQKTKTAIPAGNHDHTITLVGVDHPGVGI